MSSAWRSARAANPALIGGNSLLGGASRGRSVNTRVCCDGADAQCLRPASTAGSSAYADDGPDGHFLDTDETFVNARSRTAPNSNMDRGLFERSSVVNVTAKRPTTTPTMKFSRKWTKPRDTRVVTQREFERDNLRFLEQISRLEASHKARIPSPNPVAVEPDDADFWSSNAAGAFDLGATVPPDDEYFW